MRRYTYIFAQTYVYSHSCMCVYLHVLCKCCIHMNLCNKGKEMNHFAVLLSVKMSLYQLAIELRILPEEKWKHHSKLSFLFKRMKLKYWISTKRKSGNMMEGIICIIFVKSYSNSIKINVYKSVRLHNVLTDLFTQTITFEQ